MKKTKCVLPVIALATALTLSGCSNDEKNQKIRERLQSDAIKTCEKINHENPKICGEKIVDDYNEVYKELLFEIEKQDLLTQLLITGNATRGFSIGYAIGRHEQRIEQIKEQMKAKAETNEKE